MRIGDLALVAGVNAQTIRFYERRGILPSAAREANGYRQYDEATASLLRFIRASQVAGLSLTDIGSIIPSASPERCHASMSPHSSPSHSRLLASCSASLPRNQCPPHCDLPRAPHHLHELTTTDLLQFTAHRGGGEKAYRETVACGQLKANGFTR